MGNKKAKESLPVKPCADCVHELGANSAAKAADSLKNVTESLKNVIDAFENAEHCVCCGDVIPEGRQICLRCEKGEEEDV